MGVKFFVVNGYDGYVIMYNTSLQQSNNFTAPDSLPNDILDIDAIKGITILDTLIALTLS